MKFSEWSNGSIVIADGKPLGGPFTPTLDEIADTALELMAPGSDDVVGNLEVEHSVDGGPVTGLTWTDLDGDVVVTLTGLSISDSDFLTGVGIGTPDEGNNEVSYEYLVSLFDGDVTVNGSAFDDQFMEVGALGDATVNGNDGNDRIFVWHEKNVDYDGGDGIDTLEFSWNIGFYDNPTAGATVDLTAGTGTNPWGGTLILANVENVIGEFGHDNHLRGNAADNYLQGGTAIDELRGEGGNDSIYVKYWTNTSARPMLADGGTGVDTLFAELSDESAGLVVGTFPNDIVINRLDLINPALNTGTFHGGTFSNFEVFIASSSFPNNQSFDFRGSNLGERVNSAAGPDTVNGRGGNDIFSCGVGNDILTGGAGRDRLTGGTGLDKFDFNAIGESPVGANHDTIVDFNHTQHDRIDLSTIDADQRPGHAGNQAFVFIGANSFAHYHTLHPAVFAMIRSAGGLVQANVNASLAADFEIKVNLPALHQGDFIL